MTAQEWINANPTQAYEISVWFSNNSDGTVLPANIKNDVLSLISAIGALDALPTFAKNVFLSGNLTKGGSLAGLLASALPFLDKIPLVGPIVVGGAKTILAPTPVTLKTTVSTPLVTSAGVVTNPFPYEIVLGNVFMLPLLIVNKLRG